MRLRWGVEGRSDGRGYELPAKNHRLCITATAGGLAYVAARRVSRRNSAKVASSSDIGSSEK
jgi:hypothetical protein